MWAFFFHKTCAKFVQFVGFKWNLCCQGSRSDHSDWPGLQDLPLACWCADLGIWYRGQALAWGGESLWGQSIVKVSDMLNGIMFACRLLVDDSFDCRLTGWSDLLWTGGGLGLRSGVAQRQEPQLLQGISLESRLEEQGLGRWRISG